MCTQIKIFTTLTKLQQKELCEFFFFIKSENNFPFKTLKILKMFV